MTSEDRTMTVEQIVAFAKRYIEIDVQPWQVRMMKIVLAQMEDEPDEPEDTREGCPECDEGRIIVTGYDGVNNAWDAHCSNHCGWTS
jgi:hypothetical protein